MKTTAAKLKALLKAARARYEAMSDKELSIKEGELYRDMCIYDDEASASFYTIANRLLEARKSALA